MSDPQEIIMARPDAELRIPEAPEALKLGKPAGLMKYLGPGLIMASASIGSGEIFFASRGGAVFGYVLLWTFVAGYRIDAGIDPQGRPIHVARSDAERLRQHALLAPDAPRMPRRDPSPRPAVPAQKKTFRPPNRKRR